MDEEVDLNSSDMVRAKRKPFLCFLRRAQNFWAQETTTNISPCYALAWIDANFIEKNTTP